MQITSYKQADTFLQSLIRPAIFARLEDQKELADPLDRMRRLLELLGNPHQSYPSIHISGTSGKGSVAYLIAKMLSVAGYTVGLTTSPHLERVTERMQINSAPLSDSNFVQLVDELVPIVEKMEKEELGKPSYFEAVLALAFLSFSRNNVDIAVVEVGLEGKYDGTNVLKPLIGVLTNISLDHTAILGNSVELIAQEAVSFIKEGMHLVTGVDQPSIQRIINDTAFAKDVPVSYMGRDFMYEVESANEEGSVFHWKQGKVRSDNLQLLLPGFFQIENAALAIEAVSQLTEFVVSGEHVRTALASAVFPGRFELFHVKSAEKMYEVVLDGAHNPAKMQAFLTSLTTFYPNKRKRFIVAFKKQKEIESMLEKICAVADEILVTSFAVVTDTDYLAAVEPKEIALICQKLGYSGNIIITKHSDEAWNKVTENYKENDLIIITGSLYLAGEMRTLITAALQSAN